MKGFLSRISKLETAANKVIAPVEALFQEKKKEDRYYWAKLNKLMSIEELKELKAHLSVSPEGAETFQHLNSLVDKYGLKVSTIKLRPAEIGLINRVQFRIEKISEERRREILEGESEYSKKFWDECFKDFPLQVD